MGSGAGTIASIQILRAIAAIAVVFMHVGIDLNHWTGTSISWSMVGAVGVDLFFVISGFIMTLISWDMFGQPRAALEFMSRRLMRILPIYWLLTAIYVLFGNYDLACIVQSLLFIRGSQLHVVPVGWTLDFEMMFYCVFAIGLMAPRPVGLAAIAAAMIGLTLSGIRHFGDAIVLEFVFGMAAAVLYVRGVRISRAAGALLAGIGILTIALPGVYADHDAVRWGLPVLMILLGAVLTGPLPDNTLVRGACRVGDASYVLYLTHPPLLWLLGYFAKQSGLNFAGSVLLQTCGYVVATAIVIAIAIAIHRGVEVPMLRGLRGLLADFAPPGIARPVKAGAPG